MARSTAQATLADLRAVPDHLIGEIIDGVLVTSPRSPRQGAAVFKLLQTLGTGHDPVGFGRRGWNFLHKPALRLANRIIVPDRAGWRWDRFPFGGDDPFVSVIPDWVCEISPPSIVRTDLEVRRRIYAEAGIEHLWQFDRTTQMLEAFTRAGERWLLHATVELGEAVSIAPFDARSALLDDLLPIKDPSSEA